MQPTDLVWKSGMPKWVTASVIKGLFSDNNTSGPKGAVKPPPLPATVGDVCREAKSRHAGRSTLQANALLRSPILLASVGGVAVLLLLFAVVFLTFGSRNEPNAVTALDHHQAKANSPSPFTNKTNENNGSPNHQEYLKKNEVNPELLTAA
jgi:hypothetical protein